MPPFHKPPPDPTASQKELRAPLTNLVDDKLNKPLADVIAEELEKKEKGPSRSGAADYSHGTAEHEDDREG